MSLLTDRQNNKVNSDLSNLKYKTCYLSCTKIPGTIFTC